MGRGRDVVGLVGSTGGGQAGPAATGASGWSCWAVAHGVKALFPRPAHAPTFLDVPHDFPPVPLQTSAGARVEGSRALCPALSCLRCPSAPLQGIKCTNILTIRAMWAQAGKHWHMPLCNWHQTYVLRGCTTFGTNRIRSQITTVPTPTVAWTTVWLLPGGGRNYKTKWTLYPRVLRKPYALVGPIQPLLLPT